MHFQHTNTNINERGPLIAIVDIQLSHLIHDQMHLHQNDNQYLLALSFQTKNNLSLQTVPRLVQRIRQVKESIMNSSQANIVEQGKDQLLSCPYPKQQLIRQNLSTRSRQTPLKDITTPIQQNWQNSQSSIAFEEIYERHSPFQTKQNKKQSVVVQSDSQNQLHFKQKIDQDSQCFSMRIRSSNKRSRKGIKVLSKQKQRKGVQYGSINICSKLCNVLCGGDNQTNEKLSEKQIFLKLNVKQKKLRQSKNKRLKEQQEILSQYSENQFLRRHFAQSVQKMQKSKDLLIYKKTARDVATDRKNRKKIKDIKEVQEKRDIKGIQKMKNIDNGQIKEMKNIEHGQIKQLQAQIIKNIEFIFIQLDSNQDGLISAEYIQIKTLDIKILQIIMPVLCQMEDKDEQLSLQQFRKKVWKLIPTLNHRQSQYLFKNLGI